jgi:hypothetical protein
MVICQRCLLPVALSLGLHLPLRFLLCLPLVLLCSKHVCLTLSVAAVAAGSRSGRKVRRG